MASRALQRLIPRVTQPQGKEPLNPAFPKPQEIWLPGLSGYGLVRGYAPSTEATYTQKLTGSGRGINVSATGRRYPQADLFTGASRHAWIVVAHRAVTGATATYSVVRRAGVSVLVQEANLKVRCVLWPGGGLVTQDYILAVGPGYADYEGKVVVFGGIIAPEEAALYTGLGGVVTRSDFASGRGTLPSSPNPLCFGATETGIEAATPWTILMVEIWRETIPTVPQLTRLLVNPWGAFARPRRTWRQVAAAVPNITAVYADSVTTSSVVPRVTLDFA